MIFCLDLWCENKIILQNISKTEAGELLDIDIRVQQDSEVDPWRDTEEVAHCLPKAALGPVARQGAVDAEVHESLGVVQEYEGTISGVVDETPYSGDFKEEAH